MPSSAFSPHKYYRLEGFSSDISFITAFQSLLTEKVILIIFFFSVNELFKKKKKSTIKLSSLLRAVKCQTWSYGWCQLRVPAHAPFAHHSCESFAVQRRVPVVYLSLWSF